MAHFPSPLIEPDVPISGMRLSERLHRMSSGSSVHAAIDRPASDRLSLNPGCAFLALSPATLAPRGGCHRIRAALRHFHSLPIQKSGLSARGMSAS